MCMGECDKKVIQCGHPLCIPCAKEWFTRSPEPSCPMCRGPFKGKMVRKWVDERRERDMVFETLVDMIIEKKRVYELKVDDAGVCWMRPTTHIKKLADVQRAYNWALKVYGELEWDEEDMYDFVFFIDHSEYTDVKQPKIDFRQFKIKRIPYKRFKI